MGVLWPEPKKPEEGDEALVILKGPSQGQDLMKVEGTTPQALARNATKKLWTKDEIMEHLLSPKRSRPGNSREDFSPVRKTHLKG